MKSRFIHCGKSEESLCMLATIIITGYINALLYVSALWLVCYLLARKEHGNVQNYYLKKLYGMISFTTSIPEILLNL